MEMSRTGLCQKCLVTSSECGVKEKGTMKIIVPSLPSSFYSFYSATTIRRASFRNNRLNFHGIEARFQKNSAAYITDQDCVK